MKTIELFIKESISDTFNKKYQDSINGRYASKSNNSAWAAYQKTVKNTRQINDSAFTAFLNNENPSENDFIITYAKLWYSNEYGHPENFDMSSIIVADYCFKKYNVKIFDCKSIGDLNERHLLISYIPSDSNKNKAMVCKPCEVECQFTTSEGGWHGKNSDIHWTGDVHSVDEYAKMVLDYIKKCFE